MTHRAINNWKIIISLIMTLATFKHFFFFSKKINFETKTMLSPLILLIRNFFFYISFLCVAYTYIHIRKKVGRQMAFGQWKRVLRRDRWNEAKGKNRSRVEKGGGGKKSIHAVIHALYDCENPQEIKI